MNIENRLRMLLLGICLLFVHKGYAADVSFNVTAPSAVVVGNQFKVTYTLNAEGKDLRVPTFEGIRVLAGPTTSTSRQMSYVNGKMSSTVNYSYTYVLLAEREGSFTIPSATVKVKGKSYTSGKKTINVLKSNAKGSQSGTSSTGVSSEEMYVRTLLSKSNVFQQEAIVATIKLYTRLDIRGFENLKFPSYKGFLAYDIEQPDQLQATIENINGRNYRVYTMKQSILYPQRSGEIEIEPATLDCIIRMRTQNRSQSFFDDFFDSYQDVRKVVKTKARKVKVLAFPGTKPANFSGLSGSFKMSASVDVNTLKTNEPVTLKVKISGNGNLKLIKTPEIEWPADFETYDAKVSNSINNTASGVTGSRTFEFLAIPRYAGEFTVKPVTFSYFDTSTDSYKTLKTPPFTLKVEKGEGGENAEAVVTTFANKENVKFVGKDIRFIETGDLQLQKSKPYFFGSRNFWLIYFAPLLLFILSVLFYQKQLRDRANHAKMRNKQANPIAKKRLKLANKEMNAGNKEAFFDEILKGLWAYVSNKLAIDVSELHKDSMREQLTQRKVNEEVISDLMKLLDECEFARFAPSAASSDLKGVYKRAAGLISNLESQIK